MQVKDAMSKIVLTVGPEHTVREAAELMTRHHVGSAIVVDDALPGPGIITERDILRSIAAGEDPTTTRVRERMTFDASTATQTWDVDRAAETMVGKGFRHLLVVDTNGELCGVMSMRDVVRAKIRGGMAAS
jgi:CBS domain-containing protein